MSVKQGVCCGGFEGCRQPHSRSFSLFVFCVFRVFPLADQLVYEALKQLFVILHGHEHKVSLKEWGNFVENEEERRSCECSHDTAHHLFADEKKQTFTDLY